RHARFRWSPEPAHLVPRDVRGAGGRRGGGSAAGWRPGGVAVGGPGYGIALQRGDSRHVLGQYPGPSSGPPDPPTRRVDETVARVRLAGDRLGRRRCHTHPSVGGIRRRPDRLPALPFAEPLLAPGS